MELKICEKLFKKSTDNILIQFFRYIHVGGIAYIFDFGTLFVLTDYLNCYYLISAAIAFLIGLTINYTLSIRWVFNRRCIKEQRVEFIIFSMIGGIGLLLTELFMWFFTEKLKFWLCRKPACISRSFPLLCNKEGGTYNEN